MAVSGGDAREVADQKIRPDVGNQPLSISRVGRLPNHLNVQAREQALERIEPQRMSIENYRSSSRDIAHSKGPPSDSLFSPLTTRMPPQADSRLCKNRSRCLVPV